MTSQMLIHKQQNHKIEQLIQWFCIQLGTSEVIRESYCVIWFIVIMMLILFLETIRLVDYTFYWRNIKSVVPSLTYNYKIGNLFEQLFFQNSKMKGTYLECDSVYNI